MNPFSSINFVIPMEKFGRLGLTISVDHGVSNAKSSSVKIADQNLLKTPEGIGFIFLRKLYKCSKSVL